MENPTALTCQYVPDNDRAFKLKFSDGTEQYFKLPENAWLWQIGQALRLTSGATRELSEMAGAIFNYIVSSLANVDSKETPGALVLTFVRGLFSPDTKGAGQEVMASFADVLDYIAANQLMAKMVAVCYLKPQENSLDPEELARRVELFDKYVPANLIGKAVQYFFPNMSQSPNVTGSPSSP